MRACLLFTTEEQEERPRQKNRNTWVCAGVCCVDATWTWVPGAFIHWCCLIGMSIRLGHLWEPDPINTLSISFFIFLNETSISQ